MRGHIVCNCMSGVRRKFGRVRARREPGGRGRNYAQLSSQRLLLLDTRPGS